MCKKINVTIHIDYEIENTEKNIEKADKIYLQFNEIFKELFKDSILNNVFIQKYKTNH